MKFGKSQRPNRRRPDTIIEGPALAKLIRLPESELQQLAMRQQLPFSMSSIAGLFIRANELELWQAGANAYRRNRERSEEAFYP